MRAAGAHVALVDGALAAFLGKGEREIAHVPARGRAGAILGGTGPRRSPRPLGRAHRVAPPWAGPWPRARRSRRSPLAPFLVEAGFVRSGPGFRLASTTPTEGSDEETDLAAPDDI